MEKQNKRKFCVALGVLTVFILWTAAISLVDVRPIGPKGSSVGFSTLNGCFHELTGVHWRLYIMTDWLSLVPICFVFGFAVFGLAQWIRRKSFLKVDRNILVLGGFYLVVMAVYVFFERYTVNYRPVLIDGVLEGSYPSSTTLLVLTVIPTAMLQLNARIKSFVCRRIVISAMAVFAAFMVIARLLSGVHWVTDIIGGGLLSAGLVMMYDSFASS